MLTSLSCVLQDTVDSVTGKTKAAAGDAYASAKDTANSGAQYAQDTATTGKYKAQQTAGDASQYAADSANSVKDSANQFAGHATNKQGIFDKVKNVVTGKSNDAAAAGDQANYYARTGVDSAAQYAARANDKAGSAAGNAAQYAKDSVNQGKDAAGNAAQYAKDSVTQGKDAAGQFADHASNTAQGKQGGIWNKIKNVATGHSNDAVNAGETAGEYVSSAGSTAGQYAQDAKNQANHQAGKAGQYAQVHPSSVCSHLAMHRLRVSIQCKSVSEAILLLLRHPCSVHLLRTACIEHKLQRKLPEHICFRICAQITNTKVYVLWQLPLQFVFHARLTQGCHAQHTHLLFTMSFDCKLPCSHDCLLML